jgi:hypothetical protein
MYHKRVYKKERSNMEIKFVRSVNIGRCYNAFYYEITSTRKLTCEQIHGLRKLGFLGYGQEFNVNSQCDGKEEPAGYDTVQCLENGEVVMTYKPLKEPYFVYHVENRVDSSD